MKNLENSNFKIYLYCIVLFILFIILYYPSFKDIYHLAFSENGDNSHCLLVPIISGYFVWKKRNEINLKEIKPEKYGIIILIISLLLLILGYASSLEVLPRLTIISTLIGLILYNFGKNTFKVLIFPLVFLIFMVPIPVSIVGIVSFPLQLFATKASAYLINILSIPVLREGNMLYFENTSLEVAEACSGIRSLTAYLMIGVLLAYLMDTSMKRKALLIGSTVPLAFSANIVRVTGTGILAHFFGAKVARGFLHEFSGVVLFIFGFILIYIFYNFLEVSSKKRETY